jgi:hypothetical protein
VQPAPSVIAGDKIAALLALGIALTLHWLVLHDV